MPSTISKRTSGSISPSISRIEAEAASDDFMRTAGFRESSAEERAQFHQHLRCAERPAGVRSFLRRLFRWS